MNKTLDLMKTLLSSFFSGKEKEQMLSLLSEDIFVCGLSGDGELQGIDQINGYLNNQINQSFNRLQYECVEGKDIAENQAILRIQLTLKSVQIRLCVSGTSKKEKGLDKLCFLHFALVNQAQTKTLFQDLQFPPINNLQWKQTQAVLEAACDFAGIWLWVYDITHDVITTSESLQRDYGMPARLENFPQSWFDMGFIAPEYIELHRNKVQAIKDGSQEEEFECQVIHQDGVRHWSRIRFNRLADQPDFAVGTSQLIDTEKSMEARVEMERRRLEGEKDKPILYSITNISKKQVIECKNILLNTNNLLSNPDMDTMVMYGAASIHNEADRKQYIACHRQQTLIEAFHAGETENYMELQIKQPMGDVIWAKVVMLLLAEPLSGDIYLYESIYQNDSDKMQEELLKIILGKRYEFCGSWNSSENQFTLLHLNREDGRSTTSVIKFSEHVQAYAKTMVHPADKEYYIKCSMAACSTEKVYDQYEFTYRTIENGVIRYKRSTAYLYDMQKKIYLLLRNDITDMILAEECEKNKLEKALADTKKALNEKKELEQQSELLSLALYSLVPMVIEANVTENYYHMLNYDNFTTKKAARSGTYEDLVYVGATTVPESQRQLFTDTFSREAILEAHARGDTSIRLEHQQWGDDGILRWIETNCIFVSNRADHCLYTITLAQNITERKEQHLKLTKALQEAQSATKAKSEFLSRMSHEIRTPMNAIMGMTAIAQENKSDFLQVSDCLTKIDQSSHYLLTLLNDILEMSRIESGRTEISENEFEFSALMNGIRTIVEALAVKNEIRYECMNTVDMNYTYRGDMVRIQQVMVNILTNAIKFTKPGGRVRFSVYSEEMDKTCSKIHFTIADTGIGMSEAFMEKMFKPFTQEDGSNTSKYQGSGLGLAISKNLIELMGGTIVVDSFLGVGSTFKIELPLTRMKRSYLNTMSQQKRTEITLDESSLKGCHILMAEDHPMNVMIARKLLESRGISVTVADNGKMAVDMFERSEENTYDIILMDIRMPIMDGLEATRQIRALDRQDAATIPIIAMTANALDEDRRKTKAAGMNAHLAKPFEPKQLYSTLIEMLQK